MSANLAAKKSPKVVHIARGPLDEPGFTFTSTGLEIDPDVSFERWERYGRKLQLAEKGIQWALGDWVVFGEHHPDSTFRERASQAVEFTGRKVKTIQNYATVAGAIPKSRRRDSDVVDFSTHSEVAMLPAEEQERILAQAEESPADFSRQDARKEAKRVKRRLKLIPDELDLLHDSEVQTFLGDYIEALKKIDDVTPNAAMFLHGLIQSHIGQAQWQKDRTLEADCEAIIESFEDAYSRTDEDIYKWLIRSGYFMSDPDLDNRLELLSRHYVLEQEARKKHKDDKTAPLHAATCSCEPINKRLAKEKEGGRKETQRGDMRDVYMLYGQVTGDAASVAQARSNYENRD